MADAKPQAPRLEHVTGATVALKWALLALIAALAFSIRLFAVVRYESVIHEFVSRAGARRRVHGASCTYARRRALHRAAQRLDATHTRVRTHGHAHARAPRRPRVRTRTLTSGRPRSSPRAAAPACSAGRTSGRGTHWAASWAAPCSRA